MFPYSPPMLLLTAAALLSFGVAYNVLITWLEAHGYAEGYLAFLVAGGVAITLLIVAIIDWQAAFLVFFAFCCSGLPMVVGSWWRHVRSREQGQHVQRKEVLRD